MASSDTTEGTAPAVPLKFTAENWFAPQIVTVTGTNDDVDDGDVDYSIVSIAASSDARSKLKSPARKGTPT